jgi:hypothetical protein
MEVSLSQEKREAGKTCHCLAGLAKTSPANHLLETTDLGYARRERWLHRDHGDGRQDCKGHDVKNTARREFSEQTRFCIA